MRYVIMVLCLPSLLLADACFPPGCDVPLARLMLSAVKSLDIAIYSLNLPDVTAAIIVQSKKLPVRVAVDRTQAGGVHSTVTQLVKAGVNVRYGVQKGIMHDKFTIVDGAKLETGSYNYTTHAEISNHENQIYLEDAATVQAYQKQFESIWVRAKAVLRVGAHHQ